MVKLLSGMLSLQIKNMLLPCPPLGMIFDMLDCNKSKLSVFLLLCFIQGYGMCICTIRKSSSMWVCWAFQICKSSMKLYSFSLSLRGLDNKVTVYPLSMEDDPTNKRKTVGTHTSYMSCCLFPNSDQQVINLFCAKYKHFSDPFTWKLDSDR